MCQGLKWDPPNSCGSPNPSTSERDPLWREVFIELTGTKQGHMVGSQSNTAILIGEDTCTDAHPGDGPRRWQQTWGGASAGREAPQPASTPRRRRGAPPTPRARTHSLQMETGRLRKPPGPWSSVMAAQDQHRPWRTGRAVAETPPCSGLPGASPASRLLGAENQAQSGPKGPASGCRFPGVPGGGAARGKRPARASDSWFEVGSENQKGRRITLEEPWALLRVRRGGKPFPEGVLQPENLQVGWILSLPRSERLSVKGSKWRVEWTDLDPRPH